MKLKKLIIIIITNIISIIITYTFTYNIYSVKYHIARFDVNLYSEEINNYTNELNIGKVNDVKDIQKKADKIFNKIFGKNSTENNKPYSIYVDVDNNIWMVAGTVKENALSSTINLIVKDNGEVLALWES